MIRQVPWGGDHLENLLNFAVKQSLTSKHPLYVFTTGMGYGLDYCPPVFEGKYYRIIDGKVETIEPEGSPR